MPEETDGLARAISELRDEAASKNIDVDQSFTTELENYARHHGVAELSNDELADVITGIGELAISSQREADRLGGGLVRLILMKLCLDPFGDCSNAADRILDARRHGRDLSSLIDIDEIPG
jgi:hypothetical protein